MVVFDFAHRYPEGVAKLAAWLREGSFKHREHVVEGLENFPAALLMLFEGKNFGKLVLKVADA
jgi:NADPH-dependent curcumin reductase CurA